MAQSVWEEVWIQEIKEWLGGRTGRSVEEAFLSWERKGDWAVSWGCAARKRRWMRVLQLNHFHFCLIVERQTRYGFWAQEASTRRGWGVAKRPEKAQLQRLRRVYQEHVTRNILKRRAYLKRGNEHANEDRATFNVSRAHGYEHGYGHGNCCTVARTWGAERGTQRDVPLWQMCQCANRATNYLSVQGHSCKPGAHAHVLCHVAAVPNGRVAWRFISSIRSDGSVDNAPVQEIPNFPWNGFLTKGDVPTVVHTNTTCTTEHSNNVKWHRWLPLASSTNGSKSCKCLQTKGPASSQSATRTCASMTIHISPHAQTRKILAIPLFCCSLRRVHQPHLKILESAMGCTLNDNFNFLPQILLSFCGLNSGSVFYINQTMLRKNFVPWLRANPPSAAS